jgi:hypothetical protein
VPSRLDIIALAHRRLGVLTATEIPTPDQNAYGGDVLDALCADLLAQGIPILADAVPDSIALPVAHLLAVELAPHYEVAPRDARPRLMARIRANAFPDDRPDPVPLVDDYGFLGDDEWDVAARARWL